MRAFQIAKDTYNKEPQVIYAAETPKMIGTGALEKLEKSELKGEIGERY